MECRQRYIILVFVISWIFRLIRFLWILRLSIIAGGIDDVQRFVEHDEHVAVMNDVCVTVEQKHLNRNEFGRCTQAFSFKSQQDPERHMHTRLETQNKLVESTARVRVHEISK